MIENQEELRVSQEKIRALQDEIHMLRDQKAELESKTSSSSDGDILQIQNQVIFICLISSSGFSATTNKLSLCLFPIKHLKVFSILCS